MEKTPEKSSTEVKTSPSKKTGIIIGIVAGVVALALIIGVIVLCTKKDDNGGSEGDDSSVVEVADKTFGDDEVGYITLPEDWVEVSDYTQGVDGAAQWGSKDGKHTVGVMVVDTEVLSAKEWAEGVVENLEGSGNVKVEKLKEENFGDLGKAWVVTVEDTANKQHMVAYVMETEDGKTRYIAVESLDAKNRVFEDVKTYRLKK